jgi:hypothetical protein
MHRCLRNLSTSALAVPRHPLEAFRIRGAVDTLASRSQVALLSMRIFLERLSS